MPNSNDETVDIVESVIPTPAFDEFDPEKDTFLGEVPENLRNDYCVLQKLEGEMDKAHASCAQIIINEAGGKNIEDDGCLERLDEENSRVHKALVDFESAKTHYESYGFIFSLLLMEHLPKTNLELKICADWQVAGVSG